MRFSAAYGPGKFGLSFELFPPKTPQGEANLFQHVARLVEFRPSFITCTYGAGGSTQDTTLEIVVAGPPRVSAARGDASDVRRPDGRSASRLSAARRGEGASRTSSPLRGDPPRGDTTFRPVRGRALAMRTSWWRSSAASLPDLGIAVAGYPETHQEAPSPEVGSGESEAQGRRRGRRRHHAAVLRQRRLLSLPRSVPRQLGIRRADRAGPVADHEFRPDQANHVAVRREAAGATWWRAWKRRAMMRTPNLRSASSSPFARRRSLSTPGVPGIHFYVLNRSEAAAAGAGRSRACRDLQRLRHAESRSR